MTLNPIYLNILAIKPSVTEISRYQVILHGTLEGNMGVTLYPDI